MYDDTGLRDFFFLYRLVDNYPPAAATFIFHGFGWPSYNHRLLHAFTQHKVAGHFKFPEKRPALHIGVGTHVQVFPWVHGGPDLGFHSMPLEFRFKLGIAEIINHDRLAIICFDNLAEGISFIVLFQHCENPKRKDGPDMFYAGQFFQGRLAFNGADVQNGI